MGELQKQMLVVAGIFSAIAFAGGFAAGWGVKKYRDNKKMEELDIDVRL